MQHIDSMNNMLGSRTLIQGTLNGCSGNLMQGMGIDLAVGSLGVGMRGHGMVFLQGRERDQGT